MALVLTPEAPVDGWLAALDAEMQRAATFFVERPVVLDLGLLGPDEVAGLGEALAAREIRVVAAENAPAGAEGLPAPLAGGRATADVAVPDEAASVEAEVGDAVEPAGGDAVGAPALPAGHSLVIEGGLRSGQQVVHPEGDVTVLGSIASGAEVMAGGSVHVYGTLRGRAIAGFGGYGQARIICRTLQAELLAIDGFYLTADDMDPDVLGGPAMARLEGDQLTITSMQ